MAEKLSTLILQKNRPSEAKLKARSKASRENILIFFFDTKLRFDWAIFSII